MLYLDRAAVALLAILKQGVAADGSLVDLRGEIVQAEVDALREHLVKLLHRARRPRQRLLAASATQAWMHDDGAGRTEMRRW